MIKIPIAKPYLNQKELLLIEEVLNSGWLVQGPKVAMFEKQISKYLLSDYAIATTSCTTALHLSLLALGIGPGDEVILPSFTFIATANAIEYVGARPVFCDIDLSSYNIDVKKIPPLVSKNTKAIIPVHLFGLCANMNEIVEISKTYNLYIIEDAACALGSIFDNQYAGTFGHIGAFSFHPRKIITTGEGGMIITNNECVKNSVKTLRDQGSTASDHKRHEEGIHYLPEFKCLGYNYRMTDMQAAMGLAQLEKLDFIIEKRRSIAVKYDRAFLEIKFLKTPIEPDNYRHTYQSYVCLFMPENIDIENMEHLIKYRKVFVEYLSDNGIATRQGTHAVHLQKYYKDKYHIEEKIYPNSYVADKLTVALPLFVQMSDIEQEHVINTIRRFRCE